MFYSKIEYMKQIFKERYIADKAFYKQVFNIALPITLQSLLSSSLEIIDSIMVAAIGMTTAVSNAGMFNYIYNYASYGLSAGTSLYGAQYYSSGDYTKLKKTFGFHFLFSLSFGIFWVILFYFFGEMVLTFYLNDAQVVALGMEYLAIMIYSLPLRGINMSFSTIYRCVGLNNYSLKVTTISGIANVLFNYILIFGKFGFPKMGIKGAALASIIAVVVSLVFYIFKAFESKVVFLGSPKEMFSFDKQFISNILKRSFPLIVNETIFGFGATLFAKAFGYYGKDAMNAYYVGNQINDIFQFAIWGYGSAACILLGYTLGKNEIEEAKKQCNYLHFITFVLGIVITIFIVLFSHPIIALFNVTDPYIYNLTQMILYVFAIKVMMRIFNYVNFAILRSGGESKLISLLDAGILWTVGIPLAFISVYVLKVNNIAIALLICQLEQLVRLLFGMKQVYSYRWANNLTKE